MTPSQLSASAASFSASSPGGDVVDQPWDEVCCGCDEKRTVAGTIKPLAQGSPPEPGLSDHLHDRTRRPRCGNSVAMLRFAPYLLGGNGAAQGVAHCRGPSSVRLARECSLIGGCGYRGPVLGSYAETARLAAVGRLELLAPGAVTSPRSSYPFSSAAGGVGSRRSAERFSRAATSDRPSPCAAPRESVDLMTMMTIRIANRAPGGHGAGAPAHGCRRRRAGDVSGRRSNDAAEHAFDHQVDVLRDLRKAGRIVIEVWPAERGQRGHTRRRYAAAQASCTASGREALELIGD